jgi:hypothetical protein
MSVISLSKIKEIVNKNNETHIINLGKIDKRLEGINIPIKVKSLEETLRLKSEHKLTREKLTIMIQPFTRMPKALKEVVIQDGSYKKGMTENTYYQLIKLDEDSAKLEKMKFRERLFSILIHFDMDYIVDEENKTTMWKDAGIKPNDYNALVDLFSGIIQYDTHIELLETIIESIRNGQCTDQEIDTAISLYSFRKYLDGLDEDERKTVMDNLSKVRELTQEIEKNVNEEK